MTTGEVIALIKAFGGSGGGSSGGGVLVVHETVSGTMHSLDKTYKEISDAGFAVFYLEAPIPGLPNTVLWLSVIGGGDGEYVVDFTNNKNTFSYLTDSETGYPSYDEESQD